MSNSNHSKHHQADQKEIEHAFETYLSTFPLSQTSQSSYYSSHPSYPSHPHSTNHFVEEHGYSLPPLPKYVERNSKSNTPKTSFSSTIIPNPSPPSKTYSQHTQDSHQTNINIHPSQTIELNGAKIKVTSDISSFDKVLSTITNVLGPNQRTKWTPDICQIIEELIYSLNKESERFLKMSSRCNLKDKGLRMTQLICSSFSIYLNSSSMESTIIKNVNIGCAVFVGFLSGIQGIFKYNKFEFQYKEVGLSLDGLARMCRSQLLIDVKQRRDPSELILFVESTRDKLIKKCMET